MTGRRRHRADAACGVRHRGRARRAWRFRWKTDRRIARAAIGSRVHKPGWSRVLQILRRCTRKICHSRKIRNNRAPASRGIRRARDQDPVNFGKVPGAGIQHISRPVQGKRIVGRSCRIGGERINAPTCPGAVRVIFRRRVLRRLCNPTRNETRAKVKTLLSHLKFRSLCLVV